MAWSGSSSSPCASCKLLRRRCTQECVFAPYFPPEDPHKFAIVHKVFGASNVSKMLQELPAQQRADAVSSLVYEANARMRDPVYGCVGAISYLQQQVSQLQMQLALAKAEILCVQMQHDGHAAASSPPSASQQGHERKQLMECEAYGSPLMQNGLMLNSSTQQMMLQEACLTSRKSPYGHESCTTNFPSSIGKPLVPVHLCNFPKMWEIN